MNDAKPIRVTKRNPCAICQKTDWCTVSANGKIAFCMRVESTKQAKNGAWIHYLTEPIKPAPPPKREKEPPVAQPEMARLAVTYYERCEHPELLANALGVSAESLRREGMGYDGKNWSFPMFDACRRVIGIKLRPPAGKKFCVPGSHLGINWPKDLSGKPPLVVCEGETDTAAALDLGFDAIGRPSCSAGVEIILGFLNRQRYPHVWIFADRDDPGIKGAKGLAAVVKPMARGVKILHCPWHKDLREWLQHGGCTRPMIETLARNTAFV